MKNISSWLLVILFFLLLTSCGSSGIYNEENNREIVNRIKAQKDSISFQNDLSDKVTEFGQLAISCSQLFFHLFP